MVKWLAATAILACGIGVLGGYNFQAFNKPQGLVLDQTKWECFIREVTEGECVAYRMNDAELEKLDNRYRKHYKKQGPSFQPKQSDVLGRAEGK